MRLLRPLLTLAAVVFAVLGVAALTTQMHTGAARRAGIVTLQGDDAVALGQFFLVMSTLGLVVWLPRRWLAAGLVMWWLALMAMLGVLVFR